MAKMRAPVTAAVLVALCALVPSSLRAQDCGLECHVCGDNRWEGVFFSQGAPYNMTCVLTDEGGCDRCDEGSVNDNVVDPSLIAEIVATSSRSDLSAVVAAYGHRLLVHPDRSLFVVLGSGCDPEALHTIAFVPSETAHVLGALGVRSLVAHLSDRSESK